MENQYQKNLRYLVLPENITNDIDSNYLEYVNSIRKNSQSGDDYDANQLSLGLSVSD